jgi:uncharacterized protein (TIGR03437 family)
MLYGFGKAIALSAFLGWAGVSIAQCGFFSEADRRYPVEAVAPGSVILISSGVQVGPSLPQSASGFPLRTSLAGTSVRVTVGTVTVDAFILATESRWVRALLPSNTPLGDGQLVVSYNGQASPPDAIRVVGRRFGIYSGEFTPPGYLAPSVYVPRAVQNLNSANDVTLNSLVSPAQPGQPIVLWGTGLGAAAGDESAGPIPGDLKIAGMQVFVGNKPARILYAGRSGCCAGMDQVAFEVPPGMEGCNVPVWVRFDRDGYGSNEVMVSIASGEGACSDQHGFAEAEVRALAAGTLKLAKIDSGRGYWNAAFGLASSTNRIPFGTCSSLGWGGSPFEFGVASLKDGGAAMSIGTGQGSIEAKRNQNNSYWAQFEGRLDPGDYTVDNGPGGPDIGPVHFGFSIPRRTFAWTNKDDLTDMSLSEGLTVSWSGGDPGSGIVQIGGWFENGGETYGGEFSCLERAEKGKFTIPSAVLQLASAAAGPYGASYLMLWVGDRTSKRIAVPGFDVGEFNFVSNSPAGRSDYKEIPLR